MARYIIETDDENEHRSYLNGPALHCAVWAFSAELRNKAKHEDVPPVNWEMVRTLFFSYCGRELENYERG